MFNGLPAIAVRTPSARGSFNIAIKPEDIKLIVVRRFEYVSDPESYTSGSVATGRASLAGQVKG